MDPDVPVIVNAVVPPAAVLLAFSVNTLLPEVGFVPHDAVTPVGSPDTERFTFPENPKRGKTVTVDVVELPGATFNELGKAYKVKSGG
jgi:hypothetical protein